VVEFLCTNLITDVGMNDRRIAGLVEPLAALLAFPAELVDLLPFSFSRTGFAPFSWVGFAPLSLAALAAFLLPPDGPLFAPPGRVPVALTGALGLPLGLPGAVPAPATLGTWAGSSGGWPGAWASPGAGDDVVGGGWGLDSEGACVRRLSNAI